MKLYSYVVARDFGFAPNPFFGICTLATCKPNIRRTAAVGDWIVGTGSSQKNRTDHLVYIMEVTETTTFNEYWTDERFCRKRPNLHGSKKQAFGDNIYFQNDAGQWHQQDSHHSHSDGTPNQQNIENDTQVDKVLISSNYAYWGRSGPKIPDNFRKNGCDICAKRNHKCRFAEQLVHQFLIWFGGLNTKGYVDEPLDWVRTL